MPIATWARKGFQLQKTQQETWPVQWIYAPRKINYPADYTERVNWLSEWEAKENNSKINQLSGEFTINHVFPIYFLSWTFMTVEETVIVKHRNRIFVYFYIYLIAKIAQNCLMEKAKCRIRGVQKLELKRNRLSHWWAIRRRLWNASLLMGRINSIFGCGHGERVELNVYKCVLLVESSFL